MKLKVLGSDSLGNGYILQAQGETLLIEAGKPLKEVKRAVGFNIASIVGCVASHRHNDHAKYVKEYMAAGIYTLALADVFEAKGIDTLAFRKEIEPMKGYAVGGFQIFAFPVCHDAPCVGFLIDHKEMGRLLFVTDTMMLEYKVPGLKHVLLEANYAEDILDANIENGSVPPSMKPRLTQSHMEIETTKEILRANDLTDVNEIVLIHLSNGNSDERRFIRGVQETTGKPVYVAAAGVELDLSENPY